MKGNEVKAQRDRMLAWIRQHVELSEPEAWRSHGGAEWIAHESELKAILAEADAAEEQEP